MGRNRKVTEISEASGAFAKNPQRRRARLGEPHRSEPIGDPPQAWMDGAARAPGCEADQKCGIWRELASQAPIELKVNHRIGLEVVAALLWKFRRGYAKASEVDIMLKRADKLGLGDLVNQSRHASGKRPERAGSEWGELAG